MTDSTDINGVYAHTEDTTPHPSHGPLADRVRALWRLDHLRRNYELSKIGAVPELRSLIFDLALEEYAAETAANGPPDLRSYCKRFVGLGGPLEASIQRMLDVQQCYDSYVDDGQLACEPEWPVAGEQFGEFDIIETLGQGSVGRVYLARQKRLGDRTVVLKVSPHQGPREGRLLGRLRHPNIVPVHWVEPGAGNSMGYILMPFLGKSTLTDFLEQKDPSLVAAGSLWMKDGDFSLLAHDVLEGRASPPSDSFDAVLALAGQMAAALDYAHRNGVIHGDIKPSNVLLSPDGQPFLIDFNLGRERENLSGPLGGTLPYMAPELLRVFIGDSHSKQEARTTQEADVFAFGVLLRDLLTLLAGGVLKESPEGTPREAARKMLMRHAVAQATLRDRDRRVTRRLVELVQSCLSDIPRDRPTAGHVHRVLSSEAGRRLTKRRIKAACTAAAAVGLSAAALAWALPEAPTPYETAMGHLDKGRYAQAADAFLPMARDGNGEAAACLAHALHQSGNTKAAYAWHQRARELGFVSVGALNSLAALTADHGQGPTPVRLAAAIALSERAASMEGAPLATRLTLLRLGMAGFQEGVVDSDALLELTRNARRECGEDGGALLLVTHAFFVLFDTDGGSARELLETIAAANRAGAGITQEQLRTEQRFHNLRTQPGFDEVLEAAPAFRAGTPPSPKTIIDPRTGVAPPRRLAADSI